MERTPCGRQSRLNFLPIDRRILRESTPLSLDGPQRPRDTPYTPWPLLVSTPTTTQPFPRLCTVFRPVHSSLDLRSAARPDSSFLQVLLIESALIQIFEPACGVFDLDYLDSDLGVLSRSCVKLGQVLREARIEFSKNCRRGIDAFNRKSYRIRSCRLAIL